MNITREEIDEFISVLKITIEKNDYEPQVDKILKDYQKKTHMAGFRPGKIPFGLIRKKYRAAVLIEEINKIIPENLNKYISENNLKLLGEPIPSESQKPLELDYQDNFEFVFDIATLPTVEVTLSKEDIFQYYKIIVSDEMIDTEIDRIKKRFGTKTKSEVVSANSQISGTFEQLDDRDNIVFEGIFSQNIPFLVSMIRDEDAKNNLINKSINDRVIINVRKAFPNATELFHILQITKEEAEKIDCNFIFTIEEIEEFVDPELNQEFFDKIFGVGVVSTEEECRAKIKENVEVSFEIESDVRFNADVRNQLLSKIEIKLPEDFIFRWLKLSDRDKLKMSDEELKNNMSHLLEHFKWQIIEKYLAETNNISVTENDILNFAKKNVKLQFMSYGIFSLPDEALEKFALDSLKDEDNEKQKEKQNEIAQEALRYKISNFIKESVKLDINEVSREEFNSFFEKKSQTEN
ncbi:MAG: trigger factor [Marinilabiliaceae bacterium]|nr:trigger factor [Marinilabiliaceae bacterium]